MKTKYKEISFDEEAESKYDPVNWEYKEEYDAKEYLETDKELIIQLFGGIFEGERYIPENTSSQQV